MHFYRVHLKSPPGFIVGHEFEGVVHEVGNEDKILRVGEEVVVPFTTACGECFYCEKKLSSRREKGFLFSNSVGDSGDGGQAEYVRVRYASTTMFTVPSVIPPELVILMANSFPTGYFGASRLLKGLPKDEADSTTCVIVGAGPVGCCATASDLTSCKTVYVIDQVPERLAEAHTGGRGADIVLEVVDNPSAFDLAIQLVRPFGMVSSVGMHVGDLKLAGPTLYGKNITLALGRCPVRSIVEEALEVLVKEQDNVAFLCSTIMSLEDAQEAFQLFDHR